MPAAVPLLNRGWGLPKVTVEADAVSAIGLHLVAAQLVSQQIIEAQAGVRGVDVERMRESFVERSPLRRMSTAEDIASLAAFLCSDPARNISGQCIPVTAGEPAS